LAKVGEKAEIDLPDGTPVDGKILSVGTVATASSDSSDQGSTGGGSSSGSDSGSTIDVSLAFSGHPHLPALDEAPVTVKLAQEQAKHVLAVPVTALVATTGGGYALQVVDGSGSRQVEVHPGLFADGYVEVTGRAVGAGDRVQAPR
jgi:hypothetical protein